MVFSQTLNVLQSNLTEADWTPFWQEEDTQKLVVRFLRYPMMLRDEVWSQVVPILHRVLPLSPEVALELLLNHILLEHSGFPEVHAEKLQVEIITFQPALTLRLLWERMQEKPLDGYFIAGNPISWVLKHLSARDVVNTLKGLGSDAIQAFASHLPLPFWEGQLVVPEVTQEFLLCFGADVKVQKAFLNMTGIYSYRFTTREERHRRYPSAFYLALDVGESKILQMWGAKMQSLQDGMDGHDFDDP